MVVKFIMRFVPFQLRHIFEKSSLAIIGTRNPNEAGIKAADFFASEFASYGVNIVSGLAVVVIV